MILCLALEIVRMIYQQQPDVRVFLFTYPFKFYFFLSLFFFFFFPSVLDFQQHFRDISKNHSSVPRQFYVHLTSVIVRFVFSKS